MSIEIITGFDGSCPHDNSGVKKDKHGNYVVYPGPMKNNGASEEGLSGGSRFSSRIKNPGLKPVGIILHADWQTTSRIKNHDLGYIRHEKEDEWTMIPGTVKGSIVEYSLTIQPGITHIGLYPEYNYSQYCAFVKHLAGKGPAIEIAGKSREDRDIYLVSILSVNKDAKTFFIQARDHPYETAGSYCIEGIINLLCSNAPLANHIRSKFHIYIMPMTNPDGVYNGMCRLTWEKGADMNRIFTVNDSAHDVLKERIDIVKPSVYMNIHNFTDKFIDGLYSNEESIAEKITNHMPDDNKHHKKWLIQTHFDFLKAIGKDACPDEDKSWKNYCKEKFDAVGVTFEFPWFTLNTADMREKGKRAFTALALAVIEEKGL